MILTNWITATKMKNNERRAKQIGKDNSGLVIHHVLWPLQNINELQTSTVHSRVCACGPRRKVRVQTNSKDILTTECVTK